MYRPSHTQVHIGGQCGFCGFWHGNPGPCPNVEEIEYHPNGTIKRFKLRPLFAGNPTATTDDVKITVDGKPVG